MLKVPSQSPSTAVAAIAFATHSSIGGVDPDICIGRTRPIDGPYAPEVALQTALGTEACIIQRIDDKTFRIRLRPLVSSNAATPSAQPTTILVTARRRAEALTAARADITVVSADSLSNDDRSLAAIARQSPGLTVTNLGPGRDKIFLRGQSDGILTGRTQSTVGLYLDDLPMTFNAPDPDLELVDLKRVEVLQGPQGALYGQGSISGIVRLVTNPADPSGYSGNIEGGIGFAGRADASSNLSAVANLPLFSHSAALRIVSYRDEVGGYINDVGLKQDGTNHTLRYGGRASFHAILSPEWSVDLGNATQEIDSYNSQYVDGSHGSYTRDLGVAEPHDNSFSDMSSSLTGSFPAGVMKVSANRLDHRILSTYGATGLASDIANPSDTLTYNEYQRFRIVSAEATFVSRRQSHLEWLVGAFAGQSVETFAPKLNDLTHGTTAIYTERRRDRLTSLAAFGEVTYHLTSRLTFTAGGRYSFNGHRTSSTHELQRDKLEIPGQSLSDTHVSTEFSLQYRPGEDLLLYVQTAEGYRDAGFNTTYLNTPVLPARYQGDELENYEVGARYNAPSGRFEASGALYSTFWRNIQSDQFQTSGLPVTVNIGNGTVKGLDFQVGYRLTPNLKVRAVGQFSDASLIQALANYSTDESAGLPFIAPESADLVVEWVTKMADHPVHTSADWAFRSVTHLNFGSFQNVTMDGYATLNLTGQIHLKTFDLSVRVDNVGDVTGNTFAYGNPFTLKSQRQITPNRPRTIWLSVKRDF